MAGGGGGGAALPTLLVGRQAAPQARRGTLVQRVRQGGQQGVRARRAQRDQTGSPGRHLLGQGRRRGGELKDGRERSEGRGGWEVRWRKDGRRTVRSAAQNVSMSGRWI